MSDRLPIAISLLHPELLWAAILLPLLWWRVGARADWVQRALRTVIFGCILLALAQPSLIERRAGDRQILVLDARGGETATAAVRRLLHRLPPQDDVTLITLGAPAAPIPGVASQIALPAGALSTALDRALAEFPPGSGGAVTVIGDGRARDAHWDRAVDGLLRRGIAVDAVAVPTAPEPAHLTDLRVAPVRVGEAAQAMLTIDGEGTGLQAVLFADGVEVARSARFAADGPTRLTLGFPARHAGFVSLRASLLRDGAAPRALAAVAAVQDPLPLLYLGARQQGAPARLQTLLGPGFAVDARAPQTLGSGFDFTRYPAVMVDDVPARLLPAPVQTRLLDAVSRVGTGLFYSGGAQAFGMGGYDHMPLAAALPISLRQDDKVEQPSVALVFVIDTSGSMAGPPLDLAKQVARFAVRKLGPMDSVGVVEFYGAKQWAVPLQPARDTAAVERAIGRMQSQGSTVLYPAIQEAYYALKGSNARFRHILVITDGGVEQQRYQDLITHIADDRINLSTVRVGSEPGAEELMAQWARWGHGRYYGVADEFGLVELNLKEPQDKPAPGYRSGHFAVAPAAGRATWQGMAMRGVPPLAGFVPTAKRDAAETLLTAPGGEPVLASWQIGAGRVTAMMTEPLGQGTEGWRGWPGYGAWLGRVLARTADPQPAASLQLDRRFDQVTVTFRDPAGTGDAPMLRLIDDAGRTLGSPLSPVERAPGLFVATARLASDQPARVEARRGALLLRAADRAASDLGGGHVLPLATLAKLTGGAFAGDPRTPLIPRAGAGGRWTARSLAGALVLMALALYLAELLYRRWPQRRRLV